MGNPTIQQHWRRMLTEQGRRDPIGAAALALQFLFNGSPFSEIRTITARKDASLAGNTTLLVGPAGDSPVTVFPKVPHGSVMVIDEFDTRVDDNAGSTADDLVLSGLSVEFLNGGEKIREIPKFTIDQYFCGKFGAVKKRYVFGSEEQLKVNLIESSSGGETYDAYLSIVARLEPKWLWQIAYLHDLNPHQAKLEGVAP